MNIEFVGDCVQNQNFGINFQAKLDGQPIVCVVSTEALQDINPNTRARPVTSQYLDNKSKLEAIATRKIQNGQVENGKVFISQSDVL
ncbi:DUF1488 family protein [Vibrio anguillarum]|uniref:DUF1488 family protein n=1 Tax=Vibrio anguillarum TaxID=55601 RepID=UPI001C9D1D0F|nr:DUF1488 family protein [Vibrio anguillarum]MBY7669228.1 DUF1488 family protein [Vibrio anguillarum]